MNIITHFSTPPRFSPVQRQEKLQEIRHLKISVHEEVETRETLVEDPPTFKVASRENLR